ncbi:hypothetical protein NDU88_006689 [Pleurodeles waltl]|uniref:Uncharacterized protein n=1 Tax=Pleurodeles waltl TaxID=8319 RepID=A0AAV7LTE7_PLEWA|nr:hypothetical protein NDU88_006689 [Pleurodeles waltl]
MDTLITPEALGTQRPPGAVVLRSRGPPGDQRRRGPQRKIQGTGAAPDCTGARDGALPTPAISRIAGT